jgi:hypothetical protein
MTSPQPYLPPPSQPWGRWVIDNIASLANSANIFRRETSNNLKQLNTALLNPMRAVLWRQTTGTVNITTAGVYVPINLAGTLDPSATFNMVAATGSNVSGLKNNTDQARTVVFIATYDGRGGNNQAIGLKLALNGVAINASECRSFGGSTGQVAKTMTQWIARMEPGDEITMLAANIDGTTNLTIERFKLLAHAIA